MNETEKKLNQNSVRKNVNVKVIVTDVKIPEGFSLKSEDLICI